MLNDLRLVLRSNFYYLMQRTSIVDIKDLVGQTVDVYGWVHTRRDHGKLIFIDIRDAGCGIAPR